MPQLKTLVPDITEWQTCSVHTIKVHDVEDDCHLSFHTLAVTNQLHAPDTVSLAKKLPHAPRKGFFGPITTKSSIGQVESHTNLCQCSKEKNTNICLQ